MGHGDGRDVIAALAAQNVTIDEADVRIEIEIERWRRGETDNWCDYVGMSAVECTAYLHGAVVEELAKLRRDGWPSSCCRCGGAIEYVTDYWMFKSSEAGDPLLLHLKCPRRPLSTPLCPDPE